MSSQLSTLLFGQQQQPTWSQHNSTQPLVQLEPVAFDSLPLPPPPSPALSTTLEIINKRRKNAEAAQRARAKRKREKIEAESELEETRRLLRESHELLAEHNKELNTLREAVRNQRLVIKELFTHACEVHKASEALKTVAETVAVTDDNEKD